MKAKRSLALFLVSCLILCAFFCFGVSAADAADAANEGISTFALVSIIIGGVVLVAAVVLCIIKRFLRLIHIDVLGKTACTYNDYIRLLLKLDRIERIQELAAFPVCLDAVFDLNFAVCCSQKGRESLLCIVSLTLDSAQ